MLKKLQSIIGICLFICSPLFGDISTAPILMEDPRGKDINEGVVIPIPQDELDQNWTLAYKEITESGAWIMEYIPKGEDINNWTKLIQIQYFPFTHISQETKINAADFSNIFVQTLKNKFPEIKSNITKKADNNVLIEWSLPKASQGETAQNELAEVISTTDGLYRIAFTERVPVMKEDTKKTWKDRLAKIKVENAPEKAAK